MQNKTAQRIVYIRVFFYAPIRLAQILPHSRIDVEHKAFCIAHRLVLCPVQDVGLGNLYFVFFNQYRFDYILNFFNSRNGIFMPTGHHKAELLFGFLREELRLIGIRPLFDSGNGLSYGGIDFGTVVIPYFPRPFYNMLDEHGRIIFFIGSQKAFPFGEHGLFGRTALRVHSPPPSLFTSVINSSKFSKCRYTEAKRM